MYAASVPVFQKHLGNLDHVIDKAIADSVERKIDQKVLAGARLAPDMLPFTKQVQIMADFAKGTTARLAGVEPPKFDDNEATLDDCKARIKKTLDLLAGFKSAQLDGSEGRDITFKGGAGDMHFKGLDYLLHFALPNFFFHYTTAYDILRHNGVKLGKGDFLMGRAQPK
jgi:hypothetical protein